MHFASGPYSAGYWIGIFQDFQLAGQFRVD
jgi:hypothetical protein